MWRKTVALVSVVISVLVCGMVSYAGTDAGNIEDYIDKFRRGTGCESVSACVVRGTDVTFYGDPDGLYQIGSMTKAFTGLAVQKLMDEGKLSEEDLVSDLIPGFSALFGSEPADITVLQLLTQTSGYTNNESDYPSAEEDMTLYEWAMSISGKELAAYPGSEYAYSNVNYNLLGLIIEQVTGRSYVGYMQEEILIPLGLSNTYIGKPDNENVITGSRLGYRNAFEYEIPVVSAKVPAGYFYSNARDCARWITIWNGTADIPDEYRAAVESVKRRLLNTGDYYSGWECFEGGVIGHSGGTPNYSSRIVFNESAARGVCVLTNMNVAASTDGLCNGIYDSLSGVKIEDIPTDVWTVFDIIFTIVSGAGIVLILFILLMKKRLPVIIMGICVMILIASVCIVMPLVFGAGLASILFIWAPYSLTGSLTVLVIHEIIAVVKLRKLRTDENREKTG
ncbi:MAG: beta-lactamase family protein [Lachnospiraceae bacterium]|nr:beta-lactamase family protein [Lachnospiraceae bacterium]